MITIEQARAYYSDAGAAHDFEHVLRVLRLAERIGEAEGADMEVLRTAVLLHDVARAAEERGGPCHAEAGAELAREILAGYPVDKVDIVEIDKEVIEVAKKFFPELGNSFNDKRVNLMITDGAEYAKSCQKRYDAIFLDISEMTGLPPVGPAEILTGFDFLRNISNLLVPDGILCAQCETPFFYADFIKDYLSKLRRLFKICLLYTSPSPRD